MAMDGIKWANTLYCQAIKVSLVCCGFVAQPTPDNASPQTGGSDLVIGIQPEQEVS